MSGSGDFSVDVEELGSLATRLERCTESMTHACGDLRSATVSNLGNGDIDEAGADFKGSWEFGISQIAAVTDAIREGLQVTARTYNETDRAIQQTFAKAHHSGAGATNNASGHSSPFG
ncbi:WXG100 family type VII secretion target [Streptomyces lydicus]|uniref:WXG100 family type VII secretion target n=1 Tax=Streptomyces lydicus TaxID=47763 RepID=UPI0036FF486E